MHVIRTFNKCHFKQFCWQVNLIQELGREIPENSPEFKANLRYIVGLRPTSASWALAKEKENE